MEPRPALLGAGLGYRWVRASASLPGRCCRRPALPTQRPNARLVGRPSALISSGNFGLVFTSYRAH